jgi:hypothetical protein
VKLPPHARPGSDYGVGRPAVNQLVTPARKGERREQGAGRSQAGDREQRAGMKEQGGRRREAVDRGRMQGRREEGGRRESSSSLPPHFPSPPARCHRASVGT